MNNGILLWGAEPGRLAVIQKKAIRAVTFAKWNSHTTPSFKRLNVLKVEDVYHLRCLKFLYTLQNETAPHYFITHFDLTQNDPTSRPTRTHEALQCLKWKLIYETIPNTDNIVLEKLSTHSYNGFSIYAKKHLVEKYSLDCDNGPNCFSCQQLMLSS